MSFNFYLKNAIHLKEQSKSNMEEQRRIDVIDRVVTEGYTTELYCRVYHALKYSGYDVSALIDPCRDAYKLRFGLKDSNVINPSVDLLVEVFQTYPIDTLECIADFIEHEDKVADQDPGWEYPDDDSDQQWDTGYDSF